MWRWRVGGLGIFLLCGVYFKFMLYLLCCELPVRLYSSSDAYDLPKVLLTTRQTDIQTEKQRHLNFLYCTFTPIKHFLISTFNTDCWTAFICFLHKIIISSLQIHNLYDTQPNWIKLLDYIKRNKEGIAFLFIFYINLSISNNDQKK